MEIRYLESIDRSIHDEVNTKRKELTLLFGFDIPEVRYDGSRASAVRPFLGPTDRYMSLSEMERIMVALYGLPLPEIDLYINTTPFSTWDAERGFISLSLDRFPDGVQSAFCHEANHLMYDIAFGTEKYEDTKIKETLTVLNEVFGVKDRGWKIFSKQRQQILEFYTRERDMERTVTFARRLTEMS